MAWDKTKIVNFGIILMGDDRISNVDTTDTKPAKIMREIYDNARDALLQSYPWNFATELAVLAKDGTDPKFGFTNRFLLPTDALALLAIEDNTSVLVRPSGDPIYRVRGRFIHTDVGAPLNIFYTKRVTDEGQFTALFGEGLGARLAAIATESITQSNSKVAKIEAIFDRIIARAFSADAIENPADPLPEDIWLEERN